MIYLFDKDEKLIKIVRKSAVKTALQKYALTTERYVSDRLTVELKGLNADELEQVEYMAIQTMEDAHTFHYFYVAQKSSDELTTLIGVQSGIEELRKSPVYDKRPQNAFARDVITDLLAGTNWQARFVGETTPHSTNFYYTSVFDALKKVCEVWDLEMQFFVEMNGNRIGARYIDFKQKIGQAVGKRVVYGHNALQILQEVERTNIFTALVGRGKGEETGDGYGRKITFEDVVWSTDQGKPVNKPKGQKYLELPLMTRQYGIKNADGSMRPKIGFVDFSEEENPEVLIERTYRALIDAARPQLTLKTSSVYLRGVKVGDTIRVVRHDKKLDYDTRIFEITFNRLNNQSSDIKLGDRIGESNEAKAQTIADKAVEQFITNEFSTFVQNLPNHLPSADGFNNNWYGAEDPTVQYPGKVLINDIWFKPDPEHEGHQIMLRWTGEVWEEILRTYESESLRDRIAEEIAQVTQSMEAQSEEHDRQVADILAKAQSVESLANQAKTDAASAIAQALLSKDEAIADARAQVATVSQALNTAKTDLQNIATYQNTVDRKLEELTSSTQTLDGKINTASAKVDTVAGQIRTELTRVEGKIPTEIGGRNYLRNSRKIIRSQRRFIEVLTWEVLAGLVGKTVTFSFDIKINPGGISRPISVYRYQNNGISPALLSTVTPTSEWQRFSLSGIVRGDIVNSTYTKGAIGFYDHAGNNDYSIQLLKIELGTIATDWTPAPEDFDTEISSVKTTITQTASGVEQLSTSLATTDSKVTTAEAKIRNLVDEVSSKVSQTDYNTLSGRVDDNETAITQNATEISKRLTSTQVELVITGKGYQTKSDVDSNITGRGYITNSALQPYALSTTVQNLVQETADSFSRTISETKAMIPTKVGGRNYILNSRTVSVLSNNTQTCPISAEQLKEGSREFVRIRRLNPSLNPSLISLYTAITGFSSEMPMSGKGKISFKARASTSVNMNTMGTLISSTSTNLPWNRSQISIGTEWKTYSFDFEFVKGMTILRANPLQILPPVPNLAEFYLDLCEWQLEAGSMTSSWSPAPEDLATVTALHSVRDTVDSHTRTIGAVGETGSILDNVSKVTQTAAGLVQEVSGANGLKTQVSQLAGSWAVQNLTSSGTVLNQLNLNKDGSVKIDGKLVQITGTTYIQDGVISSAKIGSLDAGKITTGTLDAARIAVNSIDGSKMVFDQAFVNKMTANEAYLKQIFAKNAFITQVQAVTLSANKISGGILSAMNDAMQMDLNNANISFNTNATINFNSANNALVRRRGTHTAFLHFNDVTSSADANAGGVYAGLGVTSSGDGINSQSSGRFSGIRIFRSAIGYNHNATLDHVELYGDTIYLKDAFDESRGYVFKTVKMANQTIDMNLYINAIKAIAHCLNHLRANNWDWKLPNLRKAISGLMDDYINKTDFYNKLQV